jgi:hypothetical protein
VSPSPLRSQKPLFQKSWDPGEGVMFFFLPRGVTERGVRGKARPIFDLGHVRTPPCEQGLLQLGSFSLSSRSAVPRRADRIIGLDIQASMPHSSRSGWTGGQIPFCSGASSHPGGELETGSWRRIDSKCGR